MPSAEDSEFQQPAHYFRAPLACWKKSGDSVLSLPLAPFISTDPQIGRGDYDFLVGEGDLIFYSSFCGGKVGFDTSLKKLQPSGLVWKRGTLTWMRNNNREEEPPSSFSKHPQRCKWSQVPSGEKTVVKGELTGICHTRRINVSRWRSLFLSIFIRRISFCILRLCMLHSIRRAWEKMIPPGRPPSLRSRGGGGGVPYKVISILFFWSAFPSCLGFTTQFHEIDPPPSPPNCLFSEGRRRRAGKSRGGSGLSILFDLGF